MIGDRRAAYGIGVGGWVCVCVCVHMCELVYVHIDATGKGSNQVVSE